jgi:CRISPR/Cas system-associated exonuclease Cas4 (RecB family)
MAGETPCQWSPWFKTHYTGYDKVPSGFQSAIWIAQHTEMVDKLAKQRLALGETVFKEEQNSFNVKRKSGLLVAGKPDLIAINEAEQYTVYDAKTGSQSNSHSIQVMLYMMFLPYARSSYKNRVFEGCVIYSDGQTHDIPSAAVDDVKETITYFLDILESLEPPKPTASFENCKFCNIGDSDCLNRCKTNVPEIIDGYEPDMPF